jgi:AcrR family transcriptional regulator
MAMRMLHLLGDTLYRMSEDAEARPIWERPEPEERRATTPLPRARIVAAALRLADGEGLAAVSIRNVAAALEVRPMRLYSHVSGKDDLLELMMDAVYAEIAQAVSPFESSEDWRAQVSALAHATRAAVLRHFWAVDLLGGRPALGPYALEVGEMTAAAVARAPGRSDPQAWRVAVGVLNSYLLGALRREVSELRAGASSGLDKAQWQARLGPYLKRQLATGRLPMIESMVRAPDLDAEASFEAELNLVLDALTHPHRPRSAGTTWPAT